jgi:ATP-dependent helicase/nuclease subunit A
MSKHSSLVADTHTVAQQARASDPAISAWVSANAGSGKTTVLSRRVVRLLLAGTDPSRILCLTFTKAAAGEMSNRVFDLLAKWTGLGDEALAAELEDLTGQRPGAAALGRARRLFARALETPGGLKVQTIHAFCEALLHRFPLEANVPGAFTVISEAQQAELMANAQDGLLASLERDRDGALAQAYGWIAGHETDHAIERLFGSIIKHRDGIEAWLDEAGGVGPAMAALRERLAGGETLEELLVEAVASPSFDDVTLAEMVKVALAEPRNDKNKLNQNTVRFLNRAHAVLNVRDDLAKAGALFALVATEKGARKIAQFTGPAVKAKWPDLEEGIAAETARQETLQPRIRLHLTLLRTQHSMTLAQDLLARFRRAKRASAGLDYDDLIARTAALLTRRDARQWVLYKLDAGLDHILVDEAQDTSPAQWAIISALAEEFFAGDGSATGRNRTVFAVGDEKQSIYSFQGARPELFDETRRAFAKQAEAVEGPALAPVGLTLSFRSTEDVLKAVDTVFRDPFAHDGLATGNAAPTHGAARRGQAGEVEIWSLAEGAKGDAPEEWATPVDQSATRHQADLLAERMVARLKHWFDSGEKLTATGKPIRAGDILILVRSRDRFVRALTRGLKEAGIPVAGSDRLTLTDDIAVQDLIALGRVMVNREDDLSLAAVLKSPLFGLTDDDVQALALARLEGDEPRSLYEQVRADKPDVTARLISWLERADTVPVYEFYAQVLGADGGREAFYARLTREVQDVLDAFIDLTLASEEEVEPGLQAFLERLESQPPQIKRELDSRSDAIRIMTVHAAKGLEAPVVFLVDKSSPAHQANKVDPLYRLEDAAYLWVPSKDDHGAETAEALAALAKRDADEHRRLLYVAMTRAEDRLVVAGYKGANKTPEDTWHNLVSSALIADAQEIHREEAEGETPFTVHRWRVSVVDGSEAAGATGGEQAPAVSTDLPLWAKRKMRPEPDVPRPLSPSGAQYLIEDDPAEDAPKELRKDASASSPLSARRRGNIMHLMLQWLVRHGAEERGALALTYLESAAPELSSAEREALVAQVLDTLSDPALAPFFDNENAAAEVPVSGTLSLGDGDHIVTGTIDRLAVLEDAIWLLDYKTGRHVPETAAQISPVYVTQMALYRALMAQIYPDRPARAALIYTAAPEGPRMLELTAEQMDDAITLLSARLSVA